ncbi:cbb3-type cytochrome c oxidase subunit 3 [Oxalobacteraceae bacterium]|nr:cbb3-type cytochrome c oxidase subunit 3 [Oxalobacteraceae bacterium]
MGIDIVFDKASSAMTVISFLTFIAILGWTFLRSEDDFAAAASLPFDDEEHPHV